MTTISSTVTTTMPSIVTTTMSSTVTSTIQSTMTTTVPDLVLNKINGYIKIPITVTSRDLHRLGNTTCQTLHLMEEATSDDWKNGTTFILSSEVCHIEYIMLRSIIHAIGYKLTDGVDYFINDDRCDLMVHTTYPWNKYMDSR